MFTDILFAVQDGVATVTLNRPNKLNCLRFETVADLTNALRLAEGDKTVGVVVFTGAGDKAFCCGGDLSVLANLGPEEADRWHQGLIELGLFMRGLSKPIIAAVNGYCIGGGNELNLFCDLTIAAEHARFGQAGPRVGSCPLWGATQLLPLLVGEKRAKEIIFLCREYTAAQAQQLGWVNQVVPFRDLYTEVRRWADEILDMSPSAIHAAKRFIHGETAGLAASLQQGARVLTELWTSKEGQEGMRSFLRKAKPDFRSFRRPSG